jgi:hypothetical protein
VKPDLDMPSRVTVKEDRKWVADRTDAAIGWFEKAGFHDIQVHHTRTPGLLKHGLWFCSADYVEDDSLLGYNRLVVQHTDVCDCDVPE